MTFQYTQVFVIFKKKKIPVLLLLSGSSQNTPARTCQRDHLSMFAHLTFVYFTTSFDPGPKTLFLLAYLLVTGGKLQPLCFSHLTWPLLAVLRTLISTCTWCSTSSLLTPSHHPWLSLPLCLPHPGWGSCPACADDPHNPTSFGHSRTQMNSLYLDVSQASLKRLETKCLRLNSWSFPSKLALLQHSSLQERTHSPSPLTELLLTEHSGLWLNFSCSGRPSWSLSSPPYVLLLQFFQALYVFLLKDNSNDTFICWILFHVIPSTGWWASGGQIRWP